MSAQRLNFYLQDTECELLCDHKPVEKNPRRQDLEQ